MRGTRAKIIRRRVAAEWHHAQTYYKRQKITFGHLYRIAKRTWTRTGAIG